MVQVQSSFSEKTTALSVYPSAGLVWFTDRVVCRDLSGLLSWEPATKIFHSCCKYFIEFYICFCLFLKASCVSAGHD